MSAHVTHVITGLHNGGAEQFLCRLLESLRSRYRWSVISLQAGGVLRPRVRALGAPVVSLDLSPDGLPGPGAVRRLRAAARSLRPDLIQGWMWHGNLAASTAVFGARRRPPVLWSIRGMMTAGQRRLRTRVLASVAGILSRATSAVVYNSRAAADEHVSLGYARTRVHVIPNGVDTERFRPRPEARARLRAQWGVGSGRPVIGRVARRDPLKDHATFLRAAALLERRGLGATYVLVGRGFDANDPRLAGELEALGLGERVHLLGERDDVAELLSGFDVACSSSRSEGFPNAVAEAMAAAVPVVATAVGDTAALVADCGRLVSPGDAAALAGAIEELLAAGDTDRDRLGQRARARIAASYEMANAAERYDALYRHVLRGRGVAR